MFSFFLYGRKDVTNACVCHLSLCIGNLYYACDLYHLCTWLYLCVCVTSIWEAAFCVTLSAHQYPERDCRGTRMHLALPKTIDSNAAASALLASQITLTYSKVGLITASRSDLHAFCLLMELVSRLSTTIKYLCDIHIPCTNLSQIITQVHIP